MIVEVYRKNLNEHLITIWSVHDVYVSCDRFHLVGVDGLVDHFKCKDVDLRISY